VIYRFYWWAQEHGHIKNRIGSGTSEEGTRYPIQITRFQLRGRWYITSDFLLECHEIGFLPIPTDSEIDDAFVRLAQNLDVGTSARNILMFNWVLVTGVRRAELLALCIDQLPADGLPPRADGRWQLEVVGKGGKVRTIYATNDLLESTRSYWDNERQTVIRSTSAIKGAEQIFITHTTGESLSERQANRIFKDAFANAASKLHTHRVRAKFATDFINENVDAQVERVGIHNVQINLLLDALAQVLGHADKRTLRRYVQIRMRWHAQGFGKLERTRGA
jgi:site-specific recombinase XerD